MEILDFFENNPFWLWASLAAGLLALELFSGTMYLLWLGIAAAICAVISMLAPQLPFWAQTLLYSIISIIVVIMGRKFWKKTEGKNNHINQPNHRLIGESVIVIDDFVAGNGFVKYGDTQWRAICKTDNPKAGAVLVISKVEGATLEIN